MLEAYVITLLGVIAAQASPGPNLIAVASVSLAQGRKIGMFVVCGISFGMLFWSLSTAYGLGTVLEHFPYSLIAMRVVGGSYLLWLAYKGIKSAVKNEPGSIAASKNQITNIQAFKRGLLVVLTNPKAVLMWAAVATFLFGAGLTKEQVVIFGPVGAISGLIIYGFYAWLFSTNAMTKIYQRFSSYIEYAFGAAFGLLGGKLLLDGIKEIKQ